MNNVDRFFLELDREIDVPLKIILTGAYAGMLMGNVRPSMDIDFEVECATVQPDPSLDDKIDSAIRLVSERIGLPAQYSQSIQGWSQISLLDYREASWLYKKFGKVEVRVLSPECWTIGKIGRYLELDRMDISVVLKKKSISWEKILEVWVKALKQSPLSNRSREFRDHVISFLKEEGKAVWGGGFDPTGAVEQFMLLIKK